MGRKLYIVTGLAGSGKSTLAEEIAKEEDAILLSADNYRYSDDKWTKKPAANFIQDVEIALKEYSEGEMDVVIDTAYYDAHDPEQARKQFVEKLLPRATTVYMIRSTLKEQVASLIDRSVSRANGMTAQGACPETSESRANLVIKAVASYESANMELANLALTIQSRFPTITLIAGHRDELYRYLRGA